MVIGLLIACLCMLVIISFQVLGVRQALDDNTSWTHSTFTHAQASENLLQRMEDHSGRNHCSIL